MIGIINAHWLTVRDGDPRAHDIMRRHYSYHRYNDNRRTNDKRIAGPGEKMVLITLACDALFVWRKFNRPDLAGQSGVCCSVFHNESDVLSSELILEAEQLAWARWPGERLYTYVNPRKIRSSNPGYCFLCAGWRRLPQRTTRLGLIILEKLPEDL